MLLWGAIAAIALAASVSFDRLTPALGLTVAIVVVSYFLYVLGSLWPDAKGLSRTRSSTTWRRETSSMARDDAAGLALLAVVGAVAIGWALVVFPRRDLAAPS